MMTQQPDHNFHPGNLLCNLKENYFILVLTVEHRSADKRLIKVKYLDMDASVKSWWISNPKSHELNKEWPVFVT